MFMKAYKNLLFDQKQECRELKLASSYCGKIFHDLCVTYDFLLLFFFFWSSCKEGVDIRDTYRVWGKRVWKYQLTLRTIKYIIIIIIKYLRGASSSLYQSIRWIYYETTISIRSLRDFLPNSFTSFRALSEQSEAKSESCIHCHWRHNYIWCNYRFLISFNILRVYFCV